MYVQSDYIIRMCRTSSVNLLLQFCNCNTTYCFHDLVPISIIFNFSKKKTTFFYPLPLNKTVMIFWFVEKWKMNIHFNKIELEPGERFVIQSNERRKITVSFWLKKGGIHTFLFFYFHLYVSRQNAYKTKRKKTVVWAKMTICLRTSFDHLFLHTQQMRLSRFVWIRAPCGCGYRTKKKIISRSIPRSSEAEYSHNGNVIERKRQNENNETLTRETYCRLLACSIVVYECDYIFFHSKFNNIFVVYINTVIASPNDSFAHYFSGVFI